jgi:replicative DNA helicase
MTDPRTSERRAIGLALRDTGACAIVVSMLEPGYFSDSSLRDVFKAAAALYGAGRPVDLITVAAELPGRASEVAEIQAAAGSGGATEGEILCRNIQADWYRRDALGRFYTAADRLMAGDDVFEVVDDTADALARAGDFGRIDTSIRSAVPEARDELARWIAGERMDVVPTAFPSVNRRIGGYYVGELTTLASQAGAGKTTFAIDAALAYATTPGALPTLIVSAEMSRRKIAHRAATRLSGQSGQLIQMRDERASVKQYSNGLDRLAGLPIHVMDGAAPTLAEIQNAARRIQLAEGLRFVIVDYIEKIGERGDTEELRVSSIAQGLKVLAKRMNVAVLVLSQYRRAGSGPAWPDDSWLRYSGKIEQESALIFHWYWPDYWKRKHPNGEPPSHWRSEHNGFLICTKNRFGPVQAFEVNFYPDAARFEDARTPSLNGHHAEPEKDLF